MGYPHQPGQAPAPFPPQFPPGYGYPPPPPPPPKKTNWAVAAAASVGIAVLTAGGALAYTHFSGTDGEAVKASPSSSVVSSTARDDNRTTTGASGYSAREQAYLSRLGETGIDVDYPDLAISDGQQVCGILSRGGEIPDAIRQMAQNNASMGDIGAILTTVVAVQTLCPQNSTMGTSTTLGKPLPTGEDGEFVRRLQDVGLSVNSQQDTIGDGKRACAIMAQSTDNGFINAAQAVHEANPRASKTAALFLVVTAMQIYCPPS